MWEVFMIQNRQRLFLLLILSDPPSPPAAPPPVSRDRLLAPWLRESLADLRAQHGRRWRSDPPTRSRTGSYVSLSVIYKKQ